MSKLQYSYYDNNNKNKYKYSKQISNFKIIKIKTKQYLVQFINCLLHTIYVNLK